VARKKSKQAKKRKAEARFKRDIITRGEAAYVDDNGKLPPGATHEIIRRNAEGEPQIVRRRFSAV
jgi:hypothetical protein